MIHWLAELLVRGAARAWVFVHNPTGSPWLEFLQIVIPVLGGLWALRVVMLLIRGYRLGSAGTSVGVERDRLTDLVVRAGSRLLSPDFPLAERRSLFRFLQAPRVRLLTTKQAHLCVVGFFRPTILVSRGALDCLTGEELEAAMAHELTHVVRRDNLRRVFLETGALVTPVAVWVLASANLATGSATTLVAFLLLGIGVGMLTRFLALSVVSYGQERRADERAAAAMGDRLVVASALVKIGQAAGPHGLSCQPAVAGSHFGMFHVPVAARVRQLIAEPSVSRRRFFRAVKPLFAVFALGLFTVVGLGAVRAGDVLAKSQGQEKLLALAGIEANSETANPQKRPAERVLRFSSFDMGSEHCLKDPCDFEFCLPEGPEDRVMQCRVLVAEVDLSGAD